MEKLTSDTGFSPSKQLANSANTGLTGSDIELFLTLTFKSRKNKILI